SAWVCVLDVLMLPLGLNHYAAVVLAAGIAFQLTRVVLAHYAGVVRVTTWALPAMVAGLVIVPVGAPSRPALVSRVPPRASTLAAQPPNVVLIVMDTVRAANLSAYGYGRNTTPHVDRVAARGVLFEHAVSAAPWTLPSHATLFTGRWPHELSTDYERPL